MRSTGFSSAGRRFLLLALLLLTIAAVWTVTGAGSSVARAAEIVPLVESDRKLSSDGAPRVIIAFLDGEAKYLPMDVELIPGTSLRVRVSLTSKPLGDARATAYLHRVKLLDARKVLSDVDFRRSPLPLHWGGRSVHQFVDLPIPETAAGLRLFVSAVVAYDADGPDGIASHDIFSASAAIQIGEIAEMQLARMYAPILKFTEGEKFFPVDVTAMIHNSTLWADLSFGNSDRLIRTEAQLRVPGFALCWKLPILSHSPRRPAFVSDRHSQF